MRTMLYKSKRDYIIVTSEEEEKQALRDGYFDHWNPDCRKVEKEELSPQQRAAITRKRNKEAKEALNGDNSQ